MSKIQIKTSAVALTIAGSLMLPLLAGNPGSGSIPAQVERELVRRQQDIQVAERLIEAGDEAMKQGDTETAYSKYVQAVQLLPDSPNTAALRTQAIAKMSTAGIAYAEELVHEGRFNSAEKVAKTILLPQHNPTYKPAVAFLSHLEQPDFFNKTITPEFAAKREEVLQLLIQADGFYETGRYDLAIKRYHQVLNLDRYNIAARRGQERVNQQQTRYYEEAYNETRARLIWEVTSKWEQPVPNYDSARGNLGEINQQDIRGTERISNKLNRIIIPNIDLTDVTVRSAVDYLKQQSQRNDQFEADPEKRGVNIVLSLDPGTPAAAGPAVEGATPSPLDGTAGTAIADERINLNLREVPLGEALRYLATLANLKVKVEPFAVAMVPLGSASDDLFNKEYRVPPSFIPKQTQGADNQQSIFGAETSQPPGIQGRQPAKSYLASQGVEFPPGATAQYIPASSKLVVRNTRDNLDLIDVLVDAAIGVAPQQVEVESKFVEVSQDNLKELGFDWALGPFSIGSSGLSGAGGTTAAGVPLDPTQWPFVTPGSDPQVIGQNSVTSGLRSGSDAITVSGLDSLLQQQNLFLGGGGTGPAPGIFSVAGVFTNPQFQMVVRALNQKSGIDLMAAPRITTKSGQKATIRIVREFIYPTDFDPPQVPTGDGDGTTVIDTSGVVVPEPVVVTPAIPVAFETRNLGVQLDVTPIIGPDGYTIDLELIPEITDFEGFINYGSPIFGVEFDPLTGVPFTGEVPITDNVINQPIFSTRRVTTSVSVWDGSTVALGGLIREDVQKVEDKVPFLGDIPLLGRAFRSDADSRVKQNLIIFTTAKIIDAEGQALRQDFLEEEVVEPLGLPADIPGPRFEQQQFTK